MDDKELTYEDVLDVLEREKGSEQPCALPDDFYRRLREYIQRLEERSEEIGVAPSDKRERRMQRQHEKVKQIANHFFKERQKKIILAAYHRSLGQRVNTDNLIDREQQLLNEVSSLLKDLKNLVFLGEYKRKTKDEEKKKVEEVREEKDVEEEPSEKPSLEKKVEPHEELLVHIIDDVPPFVDVNTSYDLKKEDVVTLHEEIANVLIERGKARKVKL